VSNESPNVPGVDLESIENTDQVVISHPILAVRTLLAFATALREAAARTRPRPLILRSNHARIFLAGADLREIATLDARSCIEYARIGRSVVNLLERHPAPTVAAIAGSCSGGGFDIAMACDAIIAGPVASFEHPGVRRGLVTGWSGTVSAPAAIGASLTRALLIEGRRIDPETASSLGLVSEISDDPGRGALEKARDLAGLAPSRIQLWRQMRGRRFVDRFRASVVHKL
jgi:enoyl-CoA hydratase